MSDVWPSLINFSNGASQGNPFTKGYDKFGVRHSVGLLRFLVLGPFVEGRRGRAVPPTRPAASVPGGRNPGIDPCVVQRG